MNTKAVFDALPHVQSIWVTEYGNFHLHSNNCGKEVTRSTAISAKKEAKEIINEEAEAVNPLVPKKVKPKE